MFASLEVCKTSRNALADLLARMYWTRKSFSRSLVDQHPYWTVSYFLPCTRPPDIAIQGHIEHLAPCTRRDTSSLIQAFSTPSSKGCSSGGHFLFLLLLVLSRSYSLYFGEPFLLAATRGVAGRAGRASGRARTCATVRGRLWTTPGDPNAPRPPPGRSPGGQVK